jgi:hypothetical protein
VLAAIAVILNDRHQLVPDEKPSQPACSAPRASSASNRTSANARSVGTYSPYRTEPTAFRQRLRRQVAPFAYTRARVRADLARRVALVWWRSVRVFGARLLNADRQLCISLRGGAHSRRGLLLY